MRLKQLEGDFTVCKLKGREDAAFGGPFLSLTETEDELSLVCRTSAAPKSCEAREDGWACVKVEGPLDFSLVGILAELAGILAEEKISIFAVSTFDTDYILMKKEKVGRAAAALRKRGHTFE